jgi:hypothetical protein
MSAGSLTVIPQEMIAMTTSTPVTAIPKVALRALTELTGEPRLDVALLLTLQDAVNYRLEKIDEAISAYEQKYGMTFDQFQSRGKNEDLPQQFSYEMEKDYLEWDGLMSRKRKLEKIRQWLV